jgi:hypothetical protein
MLEYNHEETDGLYTRPVLDYQLMQKNWNYLTKGMSDDELADFEKAKEQLADYDKIYNIIEYSSMLHEGMNCLGK